MAIGNVVVNVEDMNGNLVTTSSATVTMASNPTGVGGTVSVSAVEGVATFGNLVFSSANLYTLTASSPGLTSAVSGNILIGSVATKLAITSQPATGSTNTPIGNVVVQLEDSNGNPVSGSTAAVTVSSSPAGVGGTLTVNAVNGIATFSNLIFSAAGSFKLTATSPGLTSATSSTITILSSSTTVVMGVPVIPRRSVRR